MDLQPLHRVPILTPCAGEGLEVDRIGAPLLLGTVRHGLRVGRLCEFCPCLGRAQTRERARPGSIFGTADGPRNVVIPYLRGRLGRLGGPAHHGADGHDHLVWRERGRVGQKLAVLIAILKSVDACQEGAWDGRCPDLLVNCLGPVQMHVCLPGARLGTN